MGVSRAHVNYVMPPALKELLWSRGIHARMSAAGALGMAY